MSSIGLTVLLLGFSTLNPLYPCVLVCHRRRRSSSLKPSFCKCTIIRNDTRGLDLNTDLNDKAVRPIDLLALSYSGKESESNDFLLHFVKFSNVHNSDRSSNATKSSLAYKNV